MAFVGTATNDAECRSLVVTSTRECRTDRAAPALWVRGGALIDRAACVSGNLTVHGLTLSDVCGQLVTDRVVAKDFTRPIEVHGDVAIDEDFVLSASTLCCPGGAITLRSQLVIDVDDPLISIRHARDGASLALGGARIAPGDINAVAIGSDVLSRGSGSLCVRHRHSVGASVPAAWVDDELVERRDPVGASHTPLSPADSKAFTQLRPVRYSEPATFGLLPESVARAYPEAAVRCAQDGTVAVDYVGLLPVLVAEIQRLRAEIDMLTGK